MRYIGLDVGHKRIGVAVSDLLQLTAQPLGILENTKKGRGQLSDWVFDYQVKTLVVGCPVNRYGNPTQQTESIRHWVQALEKNLSCQVIYWNEAYSTKAVESVLLMANMSRKKRKGVRDQQAAVFILQGYLDFIACQKKEKQNDEL